ncbi:hypothetical protein GCM10019059_35560 [Camelimonas fluminis]|uniref:Methyltransferase n=1 Tax=Camelimonas fluminis TaxID=1576911 RepID=A0ABV7UG19_9HYPH|nr:site-specific DNA-methyltransferase [Camelimonas fluminis]GHE72860.1 hypothetical protein GCM10019059_35560 [Camelimonas fluminis]
MNSPTRRRKHEAKRESAVSGASATQIGPSFQNAIQLPLLKALEDAGGSSRPADVYKAIASKMALSAEATTGERTSASGERYNIFQQQIRWARQTAVLKGHISNGARGIWTLSQAGRAELTKIRRGSIVLVYALENGMAVWSHAEDAATVIEPRSVSLIFLSPPYPGVRRHYGSIQVPEWLDWMKRLTLLWKDLLADNGTLAINLMDRFEPGTPSYSPYIERFTLSAIDDAGLHLAGRQFWHSPTKLGNIQWTVKERHQPKNTVEQILLFSKTKRPAWDIRGLPPTPYAKRSDAQLQRDDTRLNTVRPSGYDLNPAAFARRSTGSLPGNLIVAGGASGSDKYSRRCREAGLPAHPARFPAEVPRRIIGLTTLEGQTVYDPMAGSNTTGQVALEMDRRFIASEPMLDYLKGSAFRFDHRPDFESYF